MLYFVNGPFIFIQIDTTFETYDKFFNLNIDVKKKYTKKTGTTKNGWDELERERYSYFIIYLYKATEENSFNLLLYNKESKRDRP